jgi:hypothetical protein
VAPNRFAVVVKKCADPYHEFLNGSDQASSPPIPNRIRIQSFASAKQGCVRAKRRLTRTGQARLLTKVVIDGAVAGLQTAATRPKPPQKFLVERFDINASRRKIDQPPLPKLSPASSSTSNAQLSKMGVLRHLTSLCQLRMGVPRPTQRPINYGA